MVKNKTLMHRLQVKKKKLEALISSANLQIVVATSKLKESKLIAKKARTKNQCFHSYITGRLKTLFI
jgi:hypothetical protein